VRAHSLQHVPFEGLGSIEPWLAAAGYEITSTRFFESASLPGVDEVDFLVVMGGPMSVNDEDTLPWLVPEKRFIRDCIEAGRTVLGVCLGAQLIAGALGARVYRNRVKEIGWYSVQGVPSAAGSTFSFPPTLEAFHWHGDTFDLPAGAVPLARSEGCEHQAFQLGRSALAIQCHLEITPETVRDLVAHCRAELVPSTYVQSEASLLAAPLERYRTINRVMDDVLSFLHGGS